MELEKNSGKKYNPDSASGEQEKINIAMRVIADHIRAISFTIADGQIPSNTGAGYVIRRILRRAVRYGYQFLNFREPFLYELVDALISQMGNAFPELARQQKLIKKVIQEEEQAFLRTLEQGLLKLEILSNIAKSNNKTILDGEEVFELHDTYGFPADLTALIAKDYNLEIDEEGFKQALEVQRKRSRKATAIDKEDWTEIGNQTQPIFTGYDSLEEKTHILKYRKINLKGKEQYQLVLDKTPFYAESGGQVGDTGFLESSGKRIHIRDTQKENNLLILFSDALPENVNDTFTAIVDSQRRVHIADNHSATHLLHAALRKVLGKHVEQRGSLVSPDYLRFDFSHFSKVNDEELSEIENIVNQKIRENITCSTESTAHR